MKIKYFIFILIPIIQFYCSTGLQNTQKHQHPPEWYLNPPKAEDTIFGVGEGFKQNSNLAQLYADARAREMIAREIERVLYLYKKHVLGANILESPYETGDIIIKQILNKALHSGAIVDRKIVLEKDHFSAYSLCKLDSVSVFINKLINEYIMEKSAVIVPNEKLDFEELEKEIEKLEENKSNQ